MRIIYGKKWYRPSEIARLGLIKNFKGGDKYGSNYNFILAQIRAGKLEAKNYSIGTKMNSWLVSEEAIEKYLNNIFNSEE